MSGTDRDVEVHVVCVGESRVGLGPRPLRTLEKVPLHPNPVSDLWSRPVRGRVVQGWGILVVTGSPMGRDREGKCLSLPLRGFPLSTRSREGLEEAGGSPVGDGSLVGEGRRDVNG